MRAAAQRAARRGAPFEKPAKIQIEKISQHDFEPPACGPRGAGASRSVFAARRERDGSGRFGRHGLPGKRRRDRADESGLSEEDGAHGCAFVSRGRKAANFCEKKKKDLRRERGNHRGRREEPRKPSIANHADLFGGHCYCATDGAALREKEWTKFE